MPLINAKCTNCGANLEVDNAKDAAICPFCHSAYIVQKAINNYNVTNTIQNPGVVNICGGETNAFDIRGGVLQKYSGASMTPVVPENVVKIGAEAFSGSMITNITLPNTLLAIDHQAFSDCARLERIRIPNGVTSIGYGAFSGCTSLTNVTIPNGITTIGEDGDSFLPCAGVFSGCVGLTNVILPNSVTTIGRETFEGFCTMYFFDLDYVYE